MSYDDDRNFLDWLEKKSKSISPFVTPDQVRRFLTLSGVDPANFEPMGGDLVKLTNERIHMALMEARRRLIPDDLDNGIKNVVAFLVANGFTTTDSGDGVSKENAEGQLPEGCLPFPHVIMRVPNPNSLIKESLRLRELLEDRGFLFKSASEGGPSIEASFDVSDGYAIIALSGINDTMLANRTGLALKPDDDETFGRIGPEPIEAAEVDPGVEAAEAPFADLGPPHVEGMSAGLPPYGDDG